MVMRMNRRDTLRLLGLGGGTAVLAACTAPTPATPFAATAGPVGVSATPAAPAPTVAEQPRAGGTLRFGTIGDLLTLDGQDFSSGGEGLLGVWDRLLEQDEKLVPQPRLAESFDWSSDAKQLKLNLRQGVQFHTGRELTAED